MSLNLAEVLRRCAKDAPHVQTRMVPCGGLTMRITYRCVICMSMSDELEIAQADDFAASLMAFVQMHIHGEAPAMPN